MSNQRGFTLLELLIAIGVIAILATIVVLVINPAEIMKQWRDVKRMNDLRTINRALEAISFEHPDLSLGSSSVVYVSVPDPTATTTAGTNCEGLGGATHDATSLHCPASSTAALANGLGWLPVKFSSVPSGVTLSSLPISPDSEGHPYYYEYKPGGGWQLGTFLESNKRWLDAVFDGGPDPRVFEVGSYLKLSTFPYGLAAYWRFDEGSGTVAKDSSGNGQTASFYSGNPIWRTGSDCKRGGCLEFTGDDALIVAPSGWLNSSTFPGYRIVVAWVKRTGGIGPAIEQAFGTSEPGSLEILGGVGGADIAGTFDKDGAMKACILPPEWLDNEWHQVTAVAGRFPGSEPASSLEVYFRDKLVCALEPFVLESVTNAPLYFGMRGSTGGPYFRGLIDEVRIYDQFIGDRAISALFMLNK